MKGSEYDKYFDMLELSHDASLFDVRLAYSRLINLYSGDSIAVNPMQSEFSDDRKQRIMKDIEEAYNKLTGILSEDRAGADSPELTDKIILTASDSYDGDSLRRIREKKRIDLRDVELVTKIGKQYLENIELERFDALPEAVFVQGYVKAYARYLSLDAQRVADDYMKRYKEWKDGKF